MTASRIVFVVFLGVCTLSAFGQIPPPAPGAKDPLAQEPKQPAKGDNNTDTTKGDANKSDQNQDTTAGQKPADDKNPEILDDENATPEQRASTEYSGPAVLSRGISASEPMNPKNIKFTPSVGLEYVVNSGLTGTILNNNGAIQNGYGQGLQLSYGIVGEKVFRRDVFSLQFAGNLYHYANFSSLDGTDNQLGFTWRHKLSRHFLFGIRESLQEYNRNNLLLSGADVINNGVGSTLITASPVTEAFDGRVISLFNEGDITWQLNSRLSINLTGAGFFTRRASTSLYGDTGYQAGSDLAYRISRRVTVGAYYSYTHFDYIGIYGGSDVNTVGLAYSIAFNPRTQFVSRVGGSRVETTGLEEVKLDPVLAVLFGTTGTIQAAYRKNYAPDFNFQLRHKVSNLTYSVAYASGVTPGNGVILTSVRQSATAGVNYQARRVWNIAFSGGYDTLKSFGISSQGYGSYAGGLSVYRRIARHLDWHTRIDYHHYTFDETGFLRNSVVFSTGVVWSPGDMLERLW